MNKLVPYRQKEREGGERTIYIAAGRKHGEGRKKSLTI
jgi:hypothetical protein